MSLHLEKGELLKCYIQKGRISFTPVLVEEPYSPEELKKFDALYNHPKNKGKVYRTKSEALEHLRHLE